MDFVFWFLLILSFFIFTYLMKKIFKAKTFYIFSMVRSKKLAKFMDKFTHKNFWNFVAKSGIFLGFGFLAIIYWYKDDLKNKKTILKIILWLLYISVLIGITTYYMINGIGLTNAIVLFFISLITGLAGFSLYILGFYSVKIIINYIVGKHSCPGVAPVIPGVKLPGMPIKIPFIEGWLALIIILIIHEFSHGILTRIIKIKVKSFGLLLLGYFPIGAFTEPDEKKQKKQKEKIN